MTANCVHWGVEMEKEELSRVKNVKERRYARLFDAIRNSTVLLIAVALFAFFSTGFNFESLEKAININGFFTVEEYKEVLNSSLKIIDSTYDSGTENNVITYLADLIKSFTNVDYENPIKIFSARVSAFNVELSEDETQEKHVDETQKNSDDSEKNHENAPKNDNGENGKTKDNNKNDAENTSKNKKDTSYTKGDIKYSNLAGVKFNLEKILADGLSFDTDIRKKEILIYHTHTSEDYKEYGDFGVLQAGRYLKSNLNDLGVKAIHNAMTHDKDFNSSYTSSYNAVSSILKGNKDVNVIIDLHRDAVGKGKLTLVNEYKGKRYAQLMFVVGTDKTLDNPEWKENLKLAAMLYDEMNSICPGIMRPLYLTTRRYNQHMSNGSLLIEVGGDGNTINECENSMEVFAKALKAVLY